MRLLLNGRFFDSGTNFVSPSDVTLSCGKESGSQYLDFACDCFVISA